MSERERDWEVRLKTQAYMYVDVEIAASSEKLANEAALMEAKVKYEELPWEWEPNPEGKRMVAIVQTSEVQEIDDGQEVPPGFEVQNEADDLIELDEEEGEDEPADDDDAQAVLELMNAYLDIEDDLDRRRQAGEIIQSDAYAAARDMRAELRIAFADDDEVVPQTATDEPDKH